MDYYAIAMLLSSAALFVLYGIAMWQDREPPTAIP